VALSIGLIPYVTEQPGLTPYNFAMPAGWRPDWL